MSPRPASSAARSLTRAAGRAFTLSEMLVAVGAVAVISVGLAAVFQTVGRTVTTGKRLSALTQQAAVFESQLREDVARMTRDGILVMRHQFTNSYPVPPGGPSAYLRRPSILKVPAYPGQPAALQRARRIDELMFFSNGEFRTGRSDLIPGRTATARAARIYYGHGMKATPFNATQWDRSSPQYNNYYTPEFRGRFLWINELNPPVVQAWPLGMKSTQAVPSPNEHAWEWTLLRHATLLATPSVTAGSDYPAGVPRAKYYDNYSKVVGADDFLRRLASDSVFQIAGQPATNSIFRVIAGAHPLGRATNAANRNFAMFWTPRDIIGDSTSSIDTDKVQFASGVVDIAATDLSELRLVINGSLLDPSEVTSYGKVYRQESPSVGYLETGIPKVNNPSLNTTTGGGTTDPAFRNYSTVQTLPPVIARGVEAPMIRMQAWMANVFPTVAGPTPTSPTLEWSSTSADDSMYKLGSRIRYEDTPPDLRGTLDSSFITGDSLLRAIDSQRVDLLTLGTSAVAPRCTEFIVEWSFGQVYPDNTQIVVADPNNPPNGTKTIDVSRQTVWYGGTRNPYADSVGGPENRLGVFHYNPNNQDPANPQRDVASRALSPAYQPFAGMNNLSSAVQGYTPSTWLIHGGAKRYPVDQHPDEQSSLLSYFGYIDPSFVPADGEAAMPWPWPKMLRVTFTLADANDPSIEQTFQYIFNLPPEPKP